MSNDLINRSALMSKLLTKCESFEALQTAWKKLKKDLFQECKYTILMLVKGGIRNERNKR